MADPWASVDFDRLWRGREPTTRIEHRIIREMLERCDTRRILEVGIGGGRVTGMLGDLASKLVGVDRSRLVLRRYSSSGAWPKSEWVAADVRRLPFRDGAFPTAVMIRVYNFLDSPRMALGELRRILRDNGHLVLSYFPRSPVTDAVVRLKRSGSGPDSTPAPPSPTRASFLATTAAAGFVLRHEQAVGLEDLRPLRPLPTSAWWSLGRAFSRASFLPHHFVLLEASGPRTREGGGTAPSQGTPNP